MITFETALKEWELGGNKRLQDDVNAFVEEEEEVRHVIALYRPVTSVLAASSVLQTPKEKPCTKKEEELAVLPKLLSHNS